jgi:hypothetical protein
MKRSVRAVVADSGGVSPAELCRQLLAAGLDPSASLDAYRDGVPIFGVRSLREGVDLALGFDDKLLLEETNMSDIPNLKQSAAPMPRTNKPPHETPGSVETGEDDDDLAAAAKVLDAFAKLCAEHEIDLDGDTAYEQLMGRVEAGDAGPEPQRMVDDEEPLDDEVIERVLAHMRGRMSDSAMQGLEDMLRGGADDDDPMPASLRGHEGEVERLIENKDPRSAADMHEVYGGMDQIAASEMMRERGAFSPGERTERRDGARWWPGKGEPPGTGLPRAAGKAREPGSLVMAADSSVKSFAKLVGVKKRHVRQMMRGV